MKKLVAPIVMLLAGVLGVTLVTASYLSTTPITIRTLRIDDIDRKPGDEITLATGVDQVLVMVKLDDPNASYEITGDKGFKEGKNTLAIKVTGADNKSSKTYEITLIRPKLEGWCALNADKIKLWNEDYELADIYMMPELANLEDGRLPIIQENLSCFSDLLQNYIKENY